MIKMTILYGHPTDSVAFEEYYTKTHMPIAAKIKGYARFETTKFTGDTNGGKPVYYRMAELWFSSPEAMQTTMGSPEGQAVAADLANYATGSATFLVGEVEE
ncbi:conserved hypothetical protein [Pricia antarctica]|uniref:EthD domain-containing protein n=1 Tax=Pricia antarctica TaxID=641691 RepID=A0A1G7FRF5_9FLAO|nr:EthD family reductase [Pricia antarctica]SDE78448.1 conserved hypothetical protein [Pricia antarctica]